MNDQLPSFLMLTLILRGRETTLIYNKQHHDSKHNEWSWSRRLF